MERKFTFEKNRFYHLYNQGVNKQEIFFDEDDWRHFQKLLFFRNDRGANFKSSRLRGRKLSESGRGDVLVDICAYVLMSDHFHLLVKEREDGGISKFMSKLQTSFSKYINMKHDRSGPLMGRPFGARYVENDDYLRWLVSYIHLSPLEQTEPQWQENGISDPKAAWELLSSYPYSSYQDYFIADRDETSILHKEALPFFIDDLEDVQNMANLCRAT